MQHPFDPDTATLADIDDAIAEDRALMESAIEHCNSGLEAWYVLDLERLRLLRQAWT